MMFSRWLTLVASGPWQAGGWAALLGMLAVLSSALPLVPLAPLFFIGSGAVIVLTVLRQRIREAVQVIAISILATLLVGMAVGFGSVLMAVMLMGFWIPVFIAAIGVKASGLRQGLLLLTLLMAVTLVLGSMQPVTLPGEFVGLLLEQVNQQAAQPVAPEVEQAVRYWLVTYFWGWVSLSFGLMWMLALFTGRQWQGVLERPGAFATEFETLRFGAAFSVLTLVTALVGLFGANVMAQQLAAIGGFCLAVQGLSCVQAILRARDVNRVVRFVFYFLLLVYMLQLAVILSLVGLVDNVVNVRSMLAPKGGEQA